MGRFARWLTALLVIAALGGCDADEALDPHDAAAPDAAPGAVDRGAPPEDAASDAAPPLPDADVPPPRCPPGATEACDACPGATRACVDGAWGPCEPPAERCNGADDDCDGAVDEGLPGLGAPCAVGVGACAASGVQVCAAAEDALQCLATPGTPGPEACNGADDDCDGATDEDAALPCYPGPEGTRGVGLCADGEAPCLGPDQRGECRGAVLPAPEICNRHDDDCDGLVDEESAENACYSGPLGTEGVGLCAAGVRACADGIAGPCVDEVRPQREICDGADNDCDGATDEDAGDCRCDADATRRCYAGPPETEGVGPCRGGQQACEDGRWGRCDGEELPKVEQCDGVDNDCDGRVDADVVGVGEICAAGVGACQAEGLLGCVAGRLACDATPGAPATEICDGEDDDCDGLTDEGLGLGAACAAGRGACRVPGRLACAPDGGVACDARPGAPAPELCDGLDGDCDGLVDEDFALGTDCTVGQGRCLRAGVRVCGGGQARCSAQPGEPAPETCDGLDEDCDGRVDEGNPGGGQDCDAGAVGVCGAGVRTCRAGRFTCEPRAAASPEVCDGLDNDCDGRTDEDPRGGNLVQPCYDGPPGTRGVGPCAGGLRACVQGAFTPCMGQIVPALEICNLDDDDCDGEADEGLGDACICRPGAEAPCYAGPVGTVDVGVCRAGRQTCLPAGNGFGACRGAMLPDVERCDDLDNDCDGVVDEVQGVGDACQVGVGLCLARGRRVCDRGAVRCEAEPGFPEPERCDGQDDDCNGLVDDLRGLGEPCQAGQGACARAGNLLCSPAGPALACSAVAGAPSPEVCDGADNDCDGRTDEAVPGDGEACTVGVGACARRGARQCDAAAQQLRCDAQPGAPGEERCDGLDDDCDGRVDEEASDVGGACRAGLGACLAEGTRRCVGGALTCDARPGAPGPEVCNGRDDDCDGGFDEELQCAAFQSCQDALDRGFRADGVYRLDPDGDGRDTVDVYCDQTTDGGGWTLVASTRGTPLNDERGPWHADLTSLAPAAAHPGVWDGLRARIPADGDLRFTCRDAIAPAAAPMVVDLSVYAVDWYREITTGTDADACFNEAGGAGADPPPARRDNLTGEIRAPGQGWHAERTADRYLEGEDACGDVADFTIDFDDRGMDSDQSDGTDWGEDDGARKCGRSGLATGQWFLFAREPRRAPLARVAIVGPLGVDAALRQAGFHVTAFALAALPPRLDLRGFDAVFVGRYAADWALLTPDLRQALDTYSRAGGHLIAEWDGLAALATRYQPDFRFALRAPAPLAWFPFAVGGGGVRGPDTPISAALGHARDPILRSLPASLRGGGGTESFFTVDRVDVGVDTGLATIATFPGGVPDFPGAAYPAVLRGRRCGGHVILAPFDFQDPPVAGPVAQLIANLAAATTGPIDPALPDACPE